MICFQLLLCSYALHLNYVNKEHRLGKSGLKNATEFEKKIITPMHKKASYLTTEDVLGSSIRLDFHN